MHLKYHVFENFMENIIWDILYLKILWEMEHCKYKINRNLLFSVNTKCNLMSWKHRNCTGENSDVFNTFDEYIWYSKYPLLDAFEISCIWKFYGKYYLKYHVFENIMENRALQMLHFPWYFQKHSKLNIFLMLFKNRNDVII